MDSTKLQRRDLTRVERSLLKYKGIRDAITSKFGYLGRIIGRYPFYFILISFIISAMLSLGLMNIKSNDGLEYFLYSDRGKVFESKQYIKKMFPMNTSDFFILENIIDRPEFPMIYFVSKKEENMLKKDILLEIENFQKLAENITVMIEGKQISYSEICAIKIDRCFENPINRLISHMDDIVSKKLRFKFPLDIDPLILAYQTYFLNIGGVKTDNDGYVEEVNAIRLFYPVDNSNREKTRWIREWTKHFFTIVKTYNFDRIEVILDPFQSTEFEIMQFTNNCKPLILIAIMILIVFCIISFTTNNCVKSKPWLGVAAVVSAGLAVAASFGLATICEVENLQFNIILPFIIVATEIDDAFVLVACWRITNPRESVEKRMEETYTKAVVSITLTSLTNILSYCIGMSASFPSVRIFCLYAAICIFFTYIFQVTFFGGCLALSGYTESRHMHAFWCIISSEHQRGYNTFQEDDKEFYTKFFAENLLKFISYPVGKIIIILLFFINLSIGVWGVICMNEGMNVFHLFPQDSEITAGYRTFYKYFTEYPYIFHIIIDKPLDYSDPQVQKSIEDLMTKFKSNPNIAGSDLEFSWLKYYKIFQTLPISKYSLRGYDLTQKQDFIDALKDVFLKINSAKRFNNDIVFNENYTEIISSRFFVTATNLTDRDTEIRVFQEMQKIADESPLPILIYSAVSAIVEQGVIIKQLTFQLFWITSVLIFIVLFVFIPNLKCSIVVSLCVLSIVVETVGYMMFWDINLDLVSLIVIILCLGFCINYPTHICYAFLSSPHNTVNDKLKDSLYHVGFPIIQGTLTTILGPLILFSNNAYFYTTFVKLVITISIQTVFHALLVIPVLISITSYFLK